MGSTVAAIQRQAAGVAAAGAFVGPAMGAGAPALGSATKLIPSPELAPVPVPAASPAPIAVPGVPVTAAAAAGAGPQTAVLAGGDTDEFEDEFSPDDTMFVPAARGGVATANGRGNGAGSAVAAPPRVQLYDDEADSSGPPPRRTIPLVDSGPSRSRVFAGRLGGSIAAIAVVAIIVVALLLITSSGGAKHKSSTTASTKHTQTTPKKRQVIFSPAKVKVSVLNGTGFTGLAGDVGTQLTAAGYKVPAVAVTNDGGEQTVPATTVDYRPGYGNAAVHIAAALAKANSTALPKTMPATAAEIAACGTQSPGWPGRARRT
jgi:hypothetical protein